MATFHGTIATNQIDQDNERFAPEALHDLAEQAGGVPVTVGFQGDPIGRVLSTDELGGYVGVRIEAPDAYDGLYAVPQFQWHAEDVAEENGVRTYRRIRVMSLGLTHDPADTHLTPLHIKP